MQIDMMSDFILRALNIKAQNPFFVKMFNKQNSVYLCLTVCGLVCVCVNRVDEMVAEGNWCNMVFKAKHGTVIISASLNWICFYQILKH